MIITPSELAETLRQEADKIEELPLDVLDVDIEARRGLREIAPTEDNWARWEADGTYHVWIKATSDAGYSFEMTIDCHMEAQKSEANNASDD